MSGDELKEIFEKLDERGKRIVEAVAQSQLKYAREGLYLPRGDVLATSTHNLPTEGEKRLES